MRTLQISLRFLILHSMTSQEYPFRPITLQNTLVQPKSEPTDVKLEEYYRLMRMKKMLVQTQQKMENRINLFKKASQKIIKQREMEVRIFTKIKHHKNYQTHFQAPKSREEVKTADSRQRRYLRQQNESLQARNLAGELFMQRVNNAKELKQEKSRFRTIIQERRKMDLQRKLQSANGIRRTRENAKLAKQNLEKDRKQHIKRELFQKCEKEREEFLQIERQLNSLQDEEEKALLLWKKTMESKI